MKRPTILHAILAAALALPLTLAFAADGDGDGAKPDKPRGDAPAGDRRPGDRGPGGPGDRGPGRPEPPKFEDLDADGNGSVTEAEFIAFQVKQAEERAKMMFGRMDQNKDGNLSKEEMPKPRGAGDRGPGGPRGDGDGKPRGARDGDKPQGSRDGDGDTAPKRPPVES